MHGRVSVAKASKLLRNCSDLTAEISSNLIKICIKTKVVVTCIVAQSEVSEILMSCGNASKRSK